MPTPASDPPRVLHLSRSAWPVVGGMESSIEGLLGEQVRSGMEVVVASLRGATGDHGGARRVRLRRFGPRRYPFARGLAPWLEWADIVHVHGVDGLADQVVGRHPAVGISTHGGFLHTPRHRRLKSLWLRRWTRPTLARAGAVWFSSDSDQALIGGVGEVLGDGTAVEPLLVRRPVPGRWLVPGRVDVHKGIDDLLELLRHAPGLRARLHELRIVGPEARPGLVYQLRTQTGTLPVCFVGEVDDVGWRQELETADVVVLPSRHEGFGIAAVEAMIHRIPVVLSDIPPFREHLGAPGVPMDDADAFGRALRQAPTAVEARARRARRHAWSAVAARYRDAYARLLERR